MVIIVWRPVEIWYRTFIMFVGSWVMALLVFVLAGDPTLFTLSIFMSIVMVIYRPPRGWREFLPRLARFWDLIRRAPTPTDRP